MIFKSRQVNLDPKPYIPLRGGQEQMRSADPSPLGRPMRFKPRPEFEPTRDPYPWRFGLYGNMRSWRQVNEFYEWAPRREQFDTQVNPILTYLRNHGEAFDLAYFLDALGVARSDMQILRVMLDPFEENYTREHVDHARRVLERLVRLD